MLQTTDGETDTFLFENKDFIAMLEVHQPAGNNHDAGWVSP
jgi:hypothetical protein